MLIHRDYRDSTGSIIKIYDDRIEFFNSGGLYGNLSKEDLLSFNYQSQVRNKLITKSFKEIGKVDRYGSGIKRVFTTCDNYGIIAPIIKVKPNSVEFILFKQKTDQKTIHDKIVDLIIENKYITSSNSLDSKAA